MHSESFYLSAFPLRQLGGDGINRPGVGGGEQLEERAGGCEMGAVEEPETDSRFSIHSFSQSLSVSPEEECCVRPWGIRVLRREH